MVDYSRFDAIGLSDDDDDDEKWAQHKASKTTQSHAEPTTSADAAAGVSQSREQTPTPTSVAQAFASPTNSAYVPEACCAWCYTTVSSPKRCGKCSKRVFCSRACQIQDWKLGHKHWCCIAGEIGHDFEVREAQAKGLGVFAKRPFERGDVIMMERPAMHRPDLLAAASDPSHVKVAEFAIDPDGERIGPVFMRANTDFTMFVKLLDTQLPVLRHGRDLLVGYPMAMIPRIVTSDLSDRDYKQFTCDVRRNAHHPGGMENSIRMLDVVPAAASAQDAAAAEQKDREEHASSTATTSVLHKAMTLMPHRGSLREKFDLNAMGCGDDDESGLFLTMSYLNHACLANSLHHFVDPHGVKIVSASRRIEPGEEITITYVNFEADSLLNIFGSTRSTLLRKKWGFSCDCMACTDPSVGQKFDHMRELDQIILECGKRRQYDRGIRCANALIKIYDELGEHPKVYSRTYYDLFQLAIARRSTLGKANGYLRLALEHRKLLVGDTPDETVRQYEQLMKTPSSHMGFLIGER